MEEGVQNTFVDPEFFGFHHLRKKADSLERNNAIFIPDEYVLHGLAALVMIRINLSLREAVDDDFQQFVAEVEMRYCKQEIAGTINRNTLQASIHLRLIFLHWFCNFQQLVDIILISTEEGLFEFSDFAYFFRDLRGHVLLTERANSVSRNHILVDRCLRSKSQLFYGDVRSTVHHFGHRLEG